MTSPVALYALLILTCVAGAPAGAVNNTTAPAHKPAAKTAPPDANDVLQWLNLKDVDLTVEDFFSHEFKYIITRGQGEIVDFDYENGKEIIHFAGRRWQFDPHKGVYHGTGSVHISSGTAFLKTDEITFASQEAKVTMSGNVKIGNKSKTVAGDQAEYDLHSGTVVITSQDPKGCRIEQFDEQGHPTTSGNAKRVTAKLENGELRNIRFEGLDLRMPVGQGSGFSGGFLPAGPQKPSASETRPPRPHLAP